MYCTCDRLRSLAWPESDRFVLRGASNLGCRECVDRKLQVVLPGASACHVGSDLGCAFCHCHAASWPREWRWQKRKPRIKKRVLTSTSCSGFGMLCSDLGLSDSSLEAKHSQRCQSQLRALGLLSMTLHGCCAANVRVHVDSTDDLACTGGLSRTFCLRQIHRQVIGLRIASHCARKDPPFRIRSDESSHFTHCVGPCGFGLCHLRWLVA